MHFSASRPVKFAEKYPLPGTEIQFTVFYDNLLAAPEKRALAVGVGIAFAMTIAGIVLWHQLSQGQKNIMGHIGISVFVNSDRRRGMRTIYYYVAVTDC